MELRHLRYAIAIAEERHFTRAAARLGIGQPPLSQQIRILEDELGVRLFSRGPRGAELTEAGDAFLPFARAALDAAADATDAARRAARGEVGTLTIGFTGSASFHPMVTRSIRQFRDHHAGVSVRLREAATSTLLREIRRGDVDVAFLRPAPGETEGLALRQLPPERLCVALPPDHRLAGQARVRLRALRKDGFVFYPRANGRQLYDAMIAACTRTGFSPEIAQEAPELTSTVNLVAAGVGVALVPESMRQLRAEGVTYADIEETVPSADLRAAYLDVSTTRATVTNFMRTLTTLLSRAEPPQA